MSRVVLVTGAAGGIGAATVRRLLDRGDRVLAFDVAENTARHDGLLVHRGDVRDREQLSEAVQRALVQWGRLDAAVAAAAVIVGGRPLWECSEADLDLVWEVDVKGVWHTAAVCVPAMLAGPDPAGARFVAVASAAGTHGLYHLGAYNAAKHAVVWLVKGLAQDLVGTGVTACVVSPGSTRTPMLADTAALYGLDDVEEFASHQLLRRLIEPDEIAATLAFCTSREAAVLHGSVVQADGGFSP